MSAEVKRLQGEFHKRLQAIGLKRFQVAMLERDIETLVKEADEIGKQAAVEAAVVQAAPPPVE